MDGRNNPQPVAIRGFSPKPVFVNNVSSKSPGDVEL
jgi:hypothetical protein